MLCPNCSSSMQIRNFDNEIILHCDTCGSNFFEKGGIDHISTSSAQKLAEDAQGNYVLGNKKQCPKDHSPLSSLNQGEKSNQPILLECPTCHGLFVYPDDLLKYKKINNTRVDFSSVHFLPAPKTLFMLSTFAILSVAILVNYKSLSNNLSSSTKAHDVINQVNLQKSGPLTFVSFTTKVAAKSKIIFYKNGDNILEKPISTSAKKVHTISLSGIPYETGITYQIILINENGDEIRGDMMRLQ